MSKTISHYVARFDMPDYKKGDTVTTPFANFYPDLVEPVYKEDHVVPPGIIRMTNGDKEVAFGPAINHLYEQWYECFNAMGYKPHTISVNGTEWSVGEKVNATLNDRIIDRFEWKFRGKKSQNEWAAMFTETNSWDFMEHVTKLPTRTHICQLPDENGKMIDGFDGQTAWVVQDNWKIFECLLHQDNAGRVHRNFFATRAAAEKYVFDNQPFYPRGLVEPLIQAWNSMGFSPLHVGEAFDNLEAFKEKHLKDKV